eukprot:NODE_824_length_3678_cov_1.033250.p2 type:complete len:426 gc:universal NODE_824_length_3678_cov_1.033250:2091-814(-)
MHFFQIFWQDRSKKIQRENKVYSEELRNRINLKTHSVVSEKNAKSVSPCLPFELIEKILYEYQVEPITIIYHIRMKEEKMALASPFLITKELTESYLRKRHYSDLTMDDVKSNILSTILSLSNPVFPYASWITKLKLQVKKDVQLHKNIPFQNLTSCRKLTLCIYLTAIASDESIADLIKIAKMSESIEFLTVVMQTRGKDYRKVYREIQSWKRLSRCNIIVKELRPSEIDVNFPMMSVKKICVKPKDNLESQIWLKSYAKVFPNLEELMFPDVPGGIDLSVFANLRIATCGKVSNFNRNLEKLYMKVNSLPLQLSPYHISDFKIRLMFFPDPKSFELIVNYMRNMTAKYKLSITPNHKTETVFQLFKNSSKQQNRDKESVAASIPTIECLSQFEAFLQSIKENHPSIVKKILKAFAHKRQQINV